MLSSKFKLGDFVEGNNSDYSGKGIVEKIIKFGDTFAYVIDSKYEIETSYEICFGWLYFLENELILNFGPIKETDFEFPFWEVGSDLVLNLENWSLWKCDPRTSPKSKRKDHSVFYGP